jgi:hypothetical protein
MLSTLVGIGLPFLLLGVTFAVSGFSYSLGSTCFIEHEMSFTLFWGWLVGISCASLLLQFGTTGYCVYIFMSSHKLRERAWTGDESSGRDSILGKTHRENSQELKFAFSSRRRIQWRGMTAILVLQWRTILLAIAMIIEGLYFSSISWAAEAKGTSIAQSSQAVEFGKCLVVSQGDKTKCLQYAGLLAVSKNATLAGTGVMALSGVQAFLFLVHLDMFTGWGTLSRIRGGSGARNSERNRTATRVVLDHRC